MLAAGLVLACAAFAPAQAQAQGQGNLLRNGNFQDDWLTMLPELKNHHWNYTTEVFNRRDYNPDAWRITGKWEWRDADKPRGERRVVLSSGSRAAQAVNWVTVHNPKKLVGWPDAGGFPEAQAQRSTNALALVRDVTFAVRLTAQEVPAGAVTLTVSWLSTEANLGWNEDQAARARIVSASVTVPEGTYVGKSVEVKLPAADWLAAAQKDKDFAAKGALLPMALGFEISYAAGKSGTVELIEAAVTEPGPGGANVLPFGGFEPDGAEYPKGWSRAQRYRYFPPGIYYIFNTWHNANSDNRGTVERDNLVPHGGKASLRMTVPTGDEVCVTSDAVALNQTAPRLIEVRAWIKTHQLCMLQLDAEDEGGKRLNGYNFIQKNPLSMGTEDWRLIRQVFAPTTPLKSIRIKLCARGMNGFTLGGTGHQPQQNAAGVVWWDDVAVFEPESSAAELQARGVVAAPPVPTERGPHLEKLDLGEQLPGRNYLRAELVDSGVAKATMNYRFAFGADSGGSASLGVIFSSQADSRAPISVTYDLSQMDQPYEGRVSRFQLLDKDGQAMALTRFPVSTWTVPLDLELGSLYLQPEQKQFVRVNLGLTHAELARVKELRLEVLRRGTSEVLKTFTVPATPEAIAQQRAKIPVGMLDDLRNLLLTELDVSFLPLQPFDDPQRNWVLRASTVDGAGKASWSVLSSPFCRQAHDGPQPAIESVRINEHGDFLINGKPWMPWGVTYGHNPVYDGPAESGKYYDLTNLKPWGLYDRHGGNLGTRALWDANCSRHVEGRKYVPQAQLEALWKSGLYASTVFLAAGTNSWPAEHLTYLRTAPMVAAVSRGPEETFAHYAPMSAKQLGELKVEVEQLRAATGKPVMTGHGGYWNRLEFERAPFFDIYDPETEPWYPAPVHTDLRPLVEGKKQVVWLRPQMYESVPYERWRYHVFVELMRGTRGWQLAHGPADPSTFKGLHGELRHLQPAIYSHETPPVVTIAPGIEHMVRKVGGKTTIIAATTHGLTFGNWRPAPRDPRRGLIISPNVSEARLGAEVFPVGITRVTVDPHIFRDESDGYHATGEPDSLSWVPHGINHLTDPKKWPVGSKLVTWVKLDRAATPKGVMALVKADGRWTHAATWGAMDLEGLRANNERAFWFLRTFYRHARGFLGWGNKVEPYALAYLPSTTTPMGAMPGAGEWLKLELPLERISAADKLLDGVAFVHDGGRAWWARTTLVTPDGKETVVFGEHEDRPAPELLKATKISVAGLKKGTPVRVLFEDRTLTAEDGWFTDDFTGVDLYQRYGGERLGYGNAPVALHIYEVGK
ncbi:hypothetical protein LBMAG56_36400 [Verrucomicrobiota bacterium]|nr:hypothetical protein LBMAG56_36400 [Verrucomicrobiota bacterium]